MPPRSSGSLVDPPAWRVLVKYWLMKTEPSTYSWSDLLRDGKTYWDGVRNYQARNYLQAMKPGDLAFFYHSVKEKCIVGIARVISEPYPDPTAKDGDWVVVDVEPAFAFEEPVTLGKIKAEKSLAEMVLVKNSRLSVQPVRKAEFDRIAELGRKKSL